MERTNDWVDEFRQNLQMRNMASQTVKNYGFHVRRYLRFLDTLPDEKPSRQNVEAFRETLASLSGSMRKQVDAALRSYFGLLVSHGLLLSNPMNGLRSPKVVQLAQRPTLTPQEVKRMLFVPQPMTPLAVRNRTVLEVLYATAVRQGELLALNVYDVDLKEGFVWIRQGKGGKDRKVPLGSAAVGWLKHYLAYARPKIGKQQSATTLFLSSHGNALKYMELCRMIRAIASAAGIEKKVTPHVFRHTAATEMVRNGAELRYVQEYLGHSNLVTTQIYTRVTNPDLKAMIDKCHPASRSRVKAIIWKVAFQGTD